MQFQGDIIKLALENNYFRKVIATGKHSQVVLMSIASKEEIGEEIHSVDQILIFVSGEGQAILNGKVNAVKANDLVFVPAGTKHNFKNTITKELKLFTIYAPAEHEIGTIDKTKADAEHREGGD